MGHPTTVSPSFCHTALRDQLSLYPPGPVATQDLSRRRVSNPDTKSLRILVRATGRVLQVPGRPLFFLFTYCPFVSLFIFL